MTGDSTKTGSWRSKVWPARGRVDRGDDEDFKQSMAELSRQMGERAAKLAAADPAAAAQARRAALEEYDRAQERRLIWGLSAVVAAAIGAGILYLMPPFGARPVPPSAGVAVRSEPAPPVATASVAPAPAQPEAASSSPPLQSPSPAASVASAQPAAPAETEPAPVAPASSPAALRRDEVREVQTRLRSFGFNPGPVDGAAGRATTTAVMQYQQDRGQPQTGTVDRDLLEQLRQDPAPQVAQQVAQRAARPNPRPTGSTGARRSDPFEPVRAAGERIGQWLESVTR